MATDTTAQLHRLVLREYDPTANDGKGGYKTTVFGPDELGQDTQFTYNIAPRKMSRASSLGSSERPIAGTFDNLSASITLIMDRISVLGKALGVFNQATWEGATPNDGNIVGGTGDGYCTGDRVVDVVMQGLCDDGSNADIEFTRCIPSLDDDVEIGGTDIPTVTIALNPQPYNPTTHAGDGLPARTYRMGAENLEKKTRLNVTTGEYQDVTAPTTPTNPEA